MLTPVVLPPAEPGAYAVVLHMLTVTPAVHKATTNFMWHKQGGAKLLWPC